MKSYRARISVNDLNKNSDAHIEKEVLVCGWIRSVRNAKAFSFIVINDGSTINNIQVIADNKLANYEAVSKLLAGASLAITGKLVKSTGKEQGVEIQATSIEIVGTVPEDYPLQKKGTSLEFLREISYLRPRTNTFGAVFRVKHAISFATHEFYNKNGFFYINTPIITGSDCEGAGEMFSVTKLPLNNVPKVNGAIDFSQDYFGKETHLTVSGQLEGECYALALGKVYTFGPTFRAENSNTTRHLSEFWMIEPEVAFADLDEIATLATNYVKYLIGYVMDNCMKELEFFQTHYQKDLIATLSHVRNSDFKRVTYTEAVDILIKASDKVKFEFPVKWGIDLQTEHERYLTEKHFNAPTIVTNYPKNIKAFYMKQNENEEAGKETVRAMDILVPGIGEIVGGSQREDDPERLLKRIREMKLKEEDYWWYLNLRKFGGAPHAGFGLGLERIVMYLTGMSNIRDVIAFPRTPKNAEF